MRVAALSDIHGNLPALEAVLDDVASEEVEAIVVAGDTISGPWPVEVFERVRRAGARIVAGNADREVLDRSTRFGPLAAWCADRLGDERLAVAAAWPVTLELDVAGLGAVVVCHSTPRSDEVVYTRITPEAELESLLAEAAGDVVVSGHTHIQFDRRLRSGLRVVNPGSVGLPYEGRHGAYWAVLGPDVELRRTDYDVEAALAGVAANGAPLADEVVRLLAQPPTSDEATAEFERLRGA